MEITGLFTYPIKSCGALAHDTLHLTEAGPQHDRRWVITDPDGMFFTQREHPRMALIQPRFVGEQMVLCAPGMPDVAVPVYLADDTPHADVTVWRDTMQAGDAGDEVAQWLSGYMGTAARLFAHTPKTTRLTDPAYAQPAPVSFADGYPLLITTEESLAELNRRLQQRGKQPVPMARFRPNVVVKGAAAPFDEDHWTAFTVNGHPFDVAKPCARCAITTVDPQTATVPDVGEPLATLATFRKAATGGVIFGQNVIHRAQVPLAVGDVLHLL